MSPGGSTGGVGDGRSVRPDEEVPRCVARSATARHPGRRLPGGRRRPTIRRRRSCPECGRRFTTVEEAVLAVVKRSGVTEPFSRDKVIAGVRQACQGRPVDEDALALLAQRVEEAVRATRRGRDPQPRGGPGHPRPAARARRGRLPALRQRLPLVRLARGLREGDRRRCGAAAPADAAPPATHRHRRHRSRRRRASADRRPPHEPSCRHPPIYRSQTPTGQHAPGEHAMTETSGPPVSRAATPPAPAQGAGRRQGPDGRAGLHHRRRAPLRRGRPGSAATSS